MTAVKKANEIRLSESQQAQQQYQKNRSAPLTEDQQALLRKVGETPILARTTGSAQQTGSTKAKKDAKPAKHHTNKGSKKKGRGKGKCITKGKNASKKTKAVKKAQLKGKPAKIQKQVPAPPAPPAQVPAPPVEVAQVAAPPAPPAQVPTPAQVAQVPAPQEVQQPAPSGQCQVPVKHEPQQDLRTVATPARSGGPSSAPPPLPGQVVVDMLNRTQTQDQLALQTPQQKKPVETPKRKKMGDTDPDPPEPSPPDTTEPPTKEKKGFGETRKENEILQKLGQSRPQIDMKLTEGNKSIMNDLNTACNGLGLVLPMHPILQSYVQKIHVILMWIRNVHVSQKGFWTQHMFIIELSDHEH